MKRLLLALLMLGSLLTRGQSQTIELVQPGSRIVQVTGSGSTWFNALAPSKTGNALKFLRVNAGATDYELVTLAGGGDALTSAPLSQFASTTSDLLRGIMSNPTGTGSLVFATSPTFVTPTLGAATATTINGNTFSTGTYTLTGVAGKTLTFNKTLTLEGTDGTTVTFPTASATLLPNTTTSGVSATPTASGTVQVTHGLGRIPTIIRIYGLGTFTSNASATPTPFSIGTFNSTGNRCIYMTVNGTTTQASQTSTTFSVFVPTSAGNNVSGVIQNATSTTFDIVWTETGTATAQNFLWEAQ